MNARNDDREWSRVLANSEKVDWRLDDVLAESGAFDFDKPFLPEPLVGTESLEFLADPERLLLNQIRARGYLGLFGLVEEMILPFVVRHTPTWSLASLDQVRALLRFASEEAKHIELFRRFGQAFARGFGRDCPLVGPADAFARAVLSHSELGVALAILHIEWMTQQHWIACVRSDESLEPAFKKLLRYHWMEEAQHARLDTLLVAELCAESSPRVRSDAVSDYLAIVALLDGALAEQATLDLATLERASQRALDAVQRTTFQREQHAAMRRTFLVAGMTHPKFVASLARLSSNAVARVSDAVHGLR